jgi:hypothetical protein
MPKEVVLIADHEESFLERTCEKRDILKKAREILFKFILTNFCLPIPQLLTNLSQTISHKLSLTNLSITNFKTTYINHAFPPYFDMLSQSLHQHHPTSRRRINYAGNKAKAIASQADDGDPRKTLCCFRKCI